MQRISLRQLKNNQGMGFRVHSEGLWNSFILAFRYLNPVMLNIHFLSKHLGSFLNLRETYTKTFYMVNTQN